MIKLINLLGFALSLILISSPVSHTQELTVEQSSFDFSSIREGINAKVTFTIVNTGSKNVQIQEVRTFAACVEARPLANSILLPGERITLNFIFESLGYGGASVNKQIEIHYNNPTLSPLKLTVTGSVLPLEPTQAPVGELTYNFFALVDIRPPEKFIQEHIIGAINVPYETIDKWVSEASQSFSGELIIYLYCSDGTYSDKAAKRLKEKGYSQFISIVGGFKEWKKQNGKKFLISGKS